MTEREKLLTTLYAYATVRSSALADLTHARIEYQAAQSRYDTANEDYHRIVYNLITLKSDN